MEATKSKMLLNTFGKKRDKFFLCHRNFCYRFGCPCISIFPQLFFARFIRGEFLNPWLIGFISLFLISISVFLIAEIFDINSKVLLVLISGIMTTNLTITAVTATYLYELDYDMCALFFAVFSVYFLKKNNGFVF